MFELILHIGTHKTGTSSIQNFLESNKRLISKTSGHTFINNYDYGNLITIQDFKALAAEIAQNQKNYIVSCERLSGNMFTGYSDVLDILSCFSQLENLYKIKVIVFYREQVSFLESAYTQFIHQGGFGKIDDFLEKFNLESIKYTLHLAKIKEALANSEIQARTYNPKNSLDEFLTIANINLKRPKISSSSNRSYNYDAIKFASTVNEFLNDEEKIKLRRLLQPASYKSQGDSRKVMSVQKAEELAHYFSEDNNILKTDFGISIPSSIEHKEGSLKSDQIAVLTKLVLSMQQEKSELFPYYLKLESKILSVYRKIRRKFN